jgi:hypothetical protein
MDKERSRKNLRTGLLMGSIALAFLLAFIYKVWRLG